MMAQVTSQHDIPEPVAAKLAQVRRGIRAYVWLEGLAAIAIVLAAAFWAGLLLDWLFEPAPRVRIAAMIAVALGGAWVAYHWLLRRAFVRISNASLAVLLERRFKQLQDHVLTSVDMAATDEGVAIYHPELVERSRQAATAAAAKVDAHELFRRGPLVRRLAIAAALLASIPIFALTARDAFAFWMDRLALSESLWPRRVQLEVAGFPPDATGRRAQKLARDDAFELLVSADAKNHVVPKQVEFRFHSADGGRGRDSLIRIGDAVPGRDDFQQFRYDFNDVSASMTLDVVGGDDRVTDLHLDIVDRPELVGMEVECVYPEYLKRPPRRLPITGGMRIPEGTRLTLHATSTKPLTDVRVQRSADPAPQSVADLNQPTEQVHWDYGVLESDEVITLQITDTDGVTTREPYRLSLAVLPDELPQVAVRLEGVGTAITPDARVPFVGKASDDYGLDRIWCAYQINDGTVLERNLQKQPAGAQQQTEIGAFDAREPNATGNERAVTLEPGQTLFLSVRASDRYNLSPQANNLSRVGTSQQFALDVVTVPQLLALLEKRELELRQRFEGVFAKTTDTRNLLSRVEFNEPIPTPVEVDKILARRRLRVAAALQNVTQSAHEVLALADSFDDLYQQVENNRIDNVDLKTRLREQIGRPLRQLAEDSLAKLQAQLQTTSDQVADPQAGAAALAASLKLADDVLVQMQQILNRMLELESYNEVVSLLRGIIDDQQKINDRTKQQQADRIKDLFEDDK